MNVSLDLNSTIVNSYDFSQFIKIVELVEDSKSCISFEILKNNPKINALICSSDDVITELKANIPNSDIDRRCEFFNHSLFEFAPLGFQVYILKNVLLKNDSEKIVSLLNNFHRSVNLYARLIFIEEISKLDQSSFFDLFKANGFLKTNIIPIDSKLSIIEVLRV